MPRTISAGEALGHRRMRAGCQEEVIAFLAAADSPAPARRRWYREWCKATSSKCRGEDLDRVAPRARRGQQLDLLQGESSGRDAAHGGVTPQLGAEAPGSAAEKADNQDRLGAGRAVTAFTSGEDGI